MRVYRMRTYSSEEGECIEWYARKKDAVEAIENHRPFSCPFAHRTSMRLSQPLMCLTPSMN